jgi:hypothetical protein
MIKWGNRWYELGVTVCFGHVATEMGLLKPNKVLFNSSDGNLEEAYNIDTRLDINFMAIRLSNTPIVCLDVEGKDGSDVNFIKFLEGHGVSLEDLFYEKTRNNGFHVYFRSNNKKFNSFKNFNKGVHFDVLCNGKVFTTPSCFRNKSYNFGCNNPFTINTIEDIPILPSWFDELSCKLS